MMQWKIVTACLMSFLMLQVHAAGNTPVFMQAAKTNNLSVLKQQLDQGVAIDARDAGGKTALIVASQHGQLDAVKWLISKGASVNARTRSDITSFFYAVQNRYPEVARYLQRHGADINIINRHGLCPLAVAALNNDAQMVQLLLGMHADVNVKVHGSPLLIEVLGKSNEMIFNQLLAAGADVNATVEQNGKSALMIAAGMQKIEAVKALLSKGAAINARMPSGETVMHALLCNEVNKRENTFLLQLLLRKGARTSDAASPLFGFEDGTTPLICAVKREYIESARLLLDSSVDPNQTDSKGYSPLYYAVKGKNPEMVELLLQTGAMPAADEVMLDRAATDTRIGRLLLSALQPVLEMQAMHDCHQYRLAMGPQDSLSGSVAEIVHGEPVTEPFAQMPARALQGLPPVSGRFSLSPDGTWLIVREDNKKSPTEHLQSLLVYNLTNARVHRFDVSPYIAVQEAGWLIDSSYYIKGHSPFLVLDFTGTVPVLRSDYEPGTDISRLYAGGEACPWRDEKGQVTVRRPDPERSTIAWSVDGKRQYSVRATSDGEYLLFEKSPKHDRQLVKHRVAWLRQQRRSQLLATIRNPQLDRKELEQILDQIPSEKLAADHFRLSPDGHYLYYRIGVEGGRGFLGLRSQHIVVDVRSSPVRAWILTGEPWLLPQWHPNGKDLYFIDQRQVREQDPDFPPMRQPNRWRLSVASFP